MPDLILVSAAALALLLLNRPVTGYARALRARRHAQRRRGFVL